MDSSRGNRANFRASAFRRHIAWVFGLQFVAVVLACMLGIYGILPIPVAITVIVVVTAGAWFATRWQWRPVRTLARMVNHWDGVQLAPDALQLEKLFAHTDADIASLARGLQGLATRIDGYNQRERNFTRDASHELRSPLTVIKMSIDMLAEVETLSDGGVRSVRRIRRATREMEALVEALLVLARDVDTATDDVNFVVNDVLYEELASARELLSGRSVELVLEEPARFALKSSPKAFAVLCWHLIRNACQQAEQGRVVVSVLPGLVRVSNPAAAPVIGELELAKRWHAADRHGFELAIAQRISERFDWPLELQTQVDGKNVASIRFERALPAEMPAKSVP